MVLRNLSNKMIKTAVLFQNSTKITKATKVHVYSVALCYITDFFYDE